METKICTRCNVRKNLDLFYKTKSKSGTHHYCIECCKKRWKEYANKDGSPRQRKGRKPYDEQAEKVCSKCKETKLRSEFNKRTDRADGKALKARCKQCEGEDHKKWREKSVHLTTSRKRNLLSKYGMTEEEYMALHTQQGGKCAICESMHAKSTRTKWLFVDHCHTTGKVRGLLCKACNSSIGAMNDDPELLEKAVSYLRNNDD